jgi:hypothetical protein
MMVSWWIQGRRVGFCMALLVGSVSPCDCSPSPDFELSAAKQELKLTTSGSRSSATARVTIRRLRVGDSLPISLDIEPFPQGTDVPFVATLSSSQLLLGGSAIARQVVSVQFQALEGVSEGTEALFALSATSSTGDRELRFRVVVDERQPALGFGFDEGNRRERPSALARGGQASFHLTLANEGVLPGFFTVTAMAPTGWSAGLPDRPVVTRWVGWNDVDLEFLVQAGSDVAPGHRASVLVRARSLSTGEVDELELEVENGGHLHVASATGRAQPHLVLPGGSTTWVARLFPYADGPRQVSLALGSVPGWITNLSQTTVPLDPGGGPVEVQVTAQAPASAAPGSTATFPLVASTDQGEEITVELAAQVTALPRIYIVAVDALNEAYLHLDRAGTGPGSDGDWLMPRFREHMARATTYANTYDSLPSSTDMNHVGILCGALTGTVGIPSVRYFYGGRDVLGRVVRLEGSREMLRFGPTGERVVTLYEAVRSLDPLVRGAFVSGKSWVNNLLEDGGRTVRISASGDRGPDYIERPPQYVLGDPPSDPDRDTDPPAKLSFGQRSIGEIIGSFPHVTPPDDYIMDAALRIIAHEDPEVMYVLLGSMDNAQHYMGNATSLDEWDDQGTASTWDDVNLVNELATREEVLDVARDADHQVGRLLDFLEARGTLDTSFVVLAGDHGQVTHPPAAVQLVTPLRRAGISPEELAFFSGTSLAGVYDLDEETAQVVGEILEEWAIVIDRQEMQSGVDLTTGKTLALPGELLSEFWVEQDDSSEINYRWPALFAFMPDNEQFIIERGQAFPAVSRMIGGHGGPAMQHVPLIMAGPGIPIGVVRYEHVRTHQIVPTLYQLLDIPAPASVDGAPLP